MNAFVNKASKNLDIFESEQVLDESACFGEPSFKDIDEHLSVINNLKKNSL